jgi:hypothetical protein
MGMRSKAVPSVLMCDAEFGQAAVETDRLGQEGGLEGGGERKNGASMGLVVWLGLGLLNVGSVVIDKPSWPLRSGPGARAPRPALARANWRSSTRYGAPFFAMLLAAPNISNSPPRGSPRPHLQHTHPRPPKAVASIGESQLVVRPCSRTNY